MCVFERRFELYFLFYCLVFKPGIWRSKSQEIIFEILKLTKPVSPSLGEITRMTVTRIDKPVLIEHPTNHFTADRTFLEKALDLVRESQ